MLKGPRICRGLSSEAVREWVRQDQRTPSAGDDDFRKILIGYDHIITSSVQPSCDPSDRSVRVNVWHYGFIVCIHDNASEKNRRIKTAKMVSTIEGF